MAICVSRKNKVEQKASHDVVAVTSAMIKARILIDFLFSKMSNNLVSLEKIWCVKKCIVLSG